MNAYESDPSVLMTPSESAIYSELMDEIIHSFNGKPSHCQYFVTVTYEALHNETTYAINWIETACRIIARSRAAGCPVTWRVSLRPEYQVEQFAANAKKFRYRRHLTLSDYIHNAAQGS